MKKLFIFLLISLLFFSCIKEKNNNIISNKVNKPETTNMQVLPKTKKLTLQERIENYDKELVLLFQEEGNFTNSGKKEILAFYDLYSSYYSKENTVKGVYKTYCFICDEAKQTIDNTIDINFNTSSLPGFLENFPLDALGREIQWLDKRIGYIGDFNNNGIDELYLFEISSISVYPKFFEFDGVSFREIFKINGFLNVLLFTDITEVDAENKILTFETREGVKPYKEVSFIWDENNQFYEEVGSSSLWTFNEFTSEILLENIVNNELIN